MTVGDNAYRCPACGHPFKFKRDMKNHFEDDHNKGLDEFNEEFTSLDRRLSALRKNDYNENDEKVTKETTRQTKFTFRKEKDINTGKSGKSQL